MKSSALCRRAVTTFSPAAALVPTAGWCFESGEGCADAVVDAASERDVVTRCFSVEDDVVGAVELVGVAVGRAPEQEQGCVGGDGDATEGGVGGDRAQEEPER